MEGTQASQFPRFPPCAVPCNPPARHTDIPPPAISLQNGPPGALTPPPLCPQVHAHIISRLKKEMPSVFGKDNKKKQLIAKLPLLFARIQLEHHIPPGDFPDCARMQVGVGEGGDCHVRAGDGGQQDADPCAGGIWWDADPHVRMQTPMPGVGGPLGCRPLCQGVRQDSDPHARMQTPVPGDPSGC